MTVTACPCDDCQSMMVDYIMTVRQAQAAQRIMDVDAVQSLDVETQGFADDDGGDSERMDNDNGQQEDW